MTDGPDNREPVGPDRLLHLEECQVFAERALDELSEQVRLMDRRLGEVSGRLDRLLARMESLSEILRDAELEDPGEPT